MPKFKVTVVRMAKAERVIEVSAKDENAAHEAAIAAAGDLEFSSHDATYEVEYIERVEED